MNWRVLRNFGVGVLAVLALAASAATIELTQARATISVEGRTTQTQVVLPYHLDREQGTRPAQAIFEIPFDVPGQMDQPYGLYLARVGNSAAS